MKISVKNQAGADVKDLTLADSIWNIEANDLVLKKMIKLQHDSLRQGTHKTKTRSEVSGGGRKPWKQKGTGRARQGSIRATQWRGGGIPLGVGNRDFSFKINKKERVLAIKSALTEKMLGKNVVVFDNFDVKSNKTKDMMATLNNLKLEDKVLFITSDDAENLYLAVRNLPNCLVIYADEVNVYDVVNADVICLDQEVLQRGK